MLGCKHLRKSPVSPVRGSWRLRIMYGTSPDYPSLQYLSVRTRQNIGYFGDLFVVGLLVASLGPTLSALATQTGSPLRSISYLFIARSMGFMLGSAWFSPMYDRVKGNLFLSAGLAGFGLLLSVVPMVGNLWLLLLLFLLQGLLGSIANVGGNTLVVWSNRDRVGPLISGLHFIWGIGASLSPILMAQTVVATGGIRLGYLLLGLLTLPVIFWLLPVASPENIPHKDAPESGTAPGGLVVLIGIFLLLYTGVEASMGNWIYTYALSTGAMSATDAAYLNSLYWGMLTLGRLANIPLMARVRPRTILIGALSGALMSIMILEYAGDRLAGLWIGVAGLGYSFASIFPTTLAFAERRISLSGKLTGRFFACASGGSMALPWVIGQFYESHGPRVLIHAVLAGIIAAIIVFGRMMRYPRRVDRQPGVSEGQG